MRRRERAACFLCGPPAIVFETARAGASSWRAYEAAVGPLPPPLPRGRAGKKEPRGSRRGAEFNA